MWYLNRERGPGSVLIHNRRDRVEGDGVPLSTSWIDPGGPLAVARTPALGAKATAATHRRIAVRRRGDGPGWSKDKTRHHWGRDEDDLDATGNSRLFLQQKWALKHPLGGADQVLRGLAEERASAVAQARLNG